MKEVDVRITLSGVLEGDELRMLGFQTVVIDPVTGTRAPALVEFSEDGGATWTAQQLRAVIVGVNRPGDALMLHRIKKA